MRTEPMTWVQRGVAAVFMIGILALVGMVITQIRSATGVPPLPIFVGILGLALLILLAGACLALTSMAISMRRIAAANAGIPRPAASRVFSATGFRPSSAPQPEAEPVPAVPAVPSQSTPNQFTPSRPARPVGRTIVAER